jgi:small subunit ribosomal protein S2
MVDVIEEIEEFVEEGEEAIEELAEKVIDAVKGKGKSKRKTKEATKSETKSGDKKASEKSESKKEKSEDEVKAEAESTTEEKSLEERKKELLEKAKKLKEKIEEPTTEELKEQVKEKKRAEMLIPLDEYVKAGIYLGTRVVTPDMRPFVYRRRADGLAIFNTDLIDEKLKEGIEYLSKFSPEDVILVCKREAGWRAAKKFSELTGIRTFTKKYPAGVLTNKALPDFFENELTIVTDHWVDKNALNDTLKVHKNVLMICDTNNFSKGANQVIIGNNKSPKSLGVIFYLLAREYCKARGLDTADKIPDLEWWTEERDEKKRTVRADAGAKFGV